MMTRHYRELKYIIIMTIGFLSMVSCEDSLVNMHYFLFTREEISTIKINQDSAINLQTRISNIKTYEEYFDSKKDYFEFDTIHFINEQGDTLKMLESSGIRFIVRPSLSVRTYTNTNLIAGLNMIDSVSFESIYFILEKGSDDIFYKDVIMTRPNYDYLNGFDVRFFSQENTTASKNTTITYEKFEWRNNSIDSCMVFTKSDNAKNELFKITYSNKYGFLNIKDNQHEITRVE